MYLKTGEETYINQANAYVKNLLNQIKPKCFYGEKDIRTKIRKNFEDMITSFEESHIANARNLTVFQLYTKYDYFEQKAEKYKQQLK